MHLDQITVADTLATIDTIVFWIGGRVCKFSVPDTFVAFQSLTVAFLTHKKETHKKALTAFPNVGRTSSFKTVEKHIRNFFAANDNCIPCRSTNRISRYALGSSFFNMTPSTGCVNTNSGNIETPKFILTMFKMA